MFEGEIFAGELEGAGADNDLVGFGEAFDARGDVGGFSQGKALSLGAGADVADHSQAGVNADPNGDLQFFFRAQPFVEQRYAFENLSPGLNRAQRRVFVGLRIAKIRQNSVSQILGYVPLHMVDGMCAHLLVSLNDLPQFLWIKVPRQGRRAYQVAKHDGQLPALRFPSDRRSLLCSARIQGGGALLAKAIRRRIGFLTRGTAHPQRRRAGKANGRRLIRMF